VIFNFAGSDQPATQIGQGAPADVFASANRRQMDAVISGGDIASGAYALDFLAKASKLPEYTEAYSPTVLANVVS
jgi:molybdate transport system substrate-binding protein